MIPAILAAMVCCSAADLGGLPPADDLYRFPPRPVVRIAREQNRAFRHNLDIERQLWGPQWSELFDITTFETEYLWRIWDKLDDAMIQVSERRARVELGRLRALLGDECYYSGILPPSVPTWRFRELK